MANRKASKPIILKVCTTEPLRDAFKKKHGDRYMSKRMNVLMRADLEGRLIITYRNKNHSNG